MSLEKSWTLGKLFSSGINQIPSYFLTLLPVTHPLQIQLIQCGLTFQLGFKKQLMVCCTPQHGEGGTQKGKSMGMY